VASTGTVSAKALLPLASFAYDWVGGDIHGLAALASTLYGYVPKFDDVVNALNKQVSRIADDANWEGKAASAFTQNWEQISAETNAVGLVIVNTGSIVDQLASNLSKIENALEQAADVVAGHGVHVGSDGQPPEACYTNQTTEQWAEAYASFYQECIQQANNARNQAAGSLQSMYSSITSSGGSDLATHVGEGATVGDYIIDLLATKTAYANQVADKVADLEKEAAKAKQAWLDAREAARGADGKFGKMPDDVKQALSKANDELDSEKAALKTAEGDETAWSKLFGTRLSDLPGLKGVGSSIDALDDPGLLDKTVGAALDLPVVDVVAGGIGTYLNAQADIQAGVPAWAAYPLETGATVASFAAADVVAGAVGTAVGGLSIAGAPVLGVAAGAAAAGVVAYGVGDYIHNYIADFGQQWHEHGALGIVTDFGAAGVSTFDDTKHLVDDVGHVADNVWHGISSIF